MVGQLRFSLQMRAHADFYRMSKVCESWPLEDLCDMNDQDMEQLLGFYPSGKIPSFDQIRLHEEPGIVGFDGAFGWW